MVRHTKKSSRQRKSSYSRRHRGSGWMDNPSQFIAGAPGNVIHQAYGGPGKDCTGNPMSLRPGYIEPGSYTEKGLPGFRGGKHSRKHSCKHSHKHCKHHKHHKHCKHCKHHKYSKGRKHGGSAVPPPATYDIGKPVYGSITPLPSAFPNPSGAGGSVGQPGTESSGQYVNVPAGGVIPSGARTPESTPLMKQAGGRYGSAFFPLNPSNGVGLASYTPTVSIPCERGSYNPLNPDPNGIQTMSTLPMRSEPMRGGANVATSAMPYGGGVFVGASDSRAYYAPTAGYGHAFETYRAPNPVPGLMINTPYEARAFNQACIKTGGKRKSRSHRRSHRRGGSGVAYQAGEVKDLTVGELGSTKDFDNRVNVQLPVKFGGRRTRRKHRRHRK